MVTTSKTNHWGEPMDRPGPVEGPCAQRTAVAALTGASVGTFFGSVQAAWYPDPITSDKRFGGVVGRTDFKALVRTIVRPSFFLAVTGSTFALTECTAEAFRGLEKRDDGVNSLIGGIVAGAVMGAATKRFDMMAASALGTGMFMWGFAMSGIGPVWDEDELTKKVYDTLPAAHKDSDALRSLKEKYPKFA